ncbi:Ethylene-responsive transcription factor CRF1 [Hordeum vulgare]|nr:Ethylene-responsive transcription factor CRF1 [Hordeum vulgare]
MSRPVQRALLTAHSSSPSLSSHARTENSNRTAAAYAQRRCRRVAQNNSGYRGVRARSVGTFSAEIRSGEMRLLLGTFEMTHEAARAYDAAAWRLGRPRHSMNFQDTRTREQAQELAPPPRLVTAEERQCAREQEERLLIPEQDERAMARWK